MPAPSFNYTEIDATSLAVARGSIMGLVGPASKGPIGPGGDRLLRSIGDLRATFGEEITGYDAIAIARQMLSRGAQVRFSRSVHLTDITDLSTKASVAASVTIQDAVIVATGAVQTTSTALASVNDGDLLTIDVDGAPTAVTFSGVAALVTSGVEPYNLAANPSLKVKVDGGPEQIVPFASVTDFAVPGAATAAEVVTALNDGRLNGANAIVVAGPAVRLVTDSAGSDSTIQVTGGTANVALAFSTLVQSSAGPNTVPNLRAVTLQDLKDAIEAVPVVGITLTLSGGTLTITTVATGAAVSLGFDGDADIPEKWGWTTGAGGDTTGSAGSAGDNTLSVTAREDGTWANGTVVTIAAASSGIAAQFKMTVGSPGLGYQAETYDNLTIADIPNLVSSLWLFADETSSHSPPDDRPVNGSYTLASGDNGTSAMTAATQVGSSQAQTGLYGFSVKDFLDVFVPDVTDNTQHNNIKTWCENNRVLGHLSMPNGISSAAAVTFRNGTGAYAGRTQLNSSFVAYHFGDMEYVDASSPTGETRTDYDSAGALGGVLSRNDTTRLQSLNIPGPHLVPAGSERGASSSLGVHYDVSADSALADALADAHVNWFQLESGVVIAMGNRTTLQDITKATKYMSIRRLMIQFGRDIEPILRRAIYEPHDEILWRSTYRALVPIMQSYFTARAFYDPTQFGVVDYGIECDQRARKLADAQLNTAQVREAGRFLCNFSVYPTFAVERIDVTTSISSSASLSITEL